jgi:hypothetical protein
MWTHQVFGALLAWMDSARASESMLSRRQFAFAPVALLALRAMPGGDRKVEHPDPRPGITGEHVLPASGFKNKRVALAYDHAREVPEILDGLYCHCNCAHAMGHRSLLSCFEGDQAAGCMTCREQGELAYKLARDGKSLADIRLAVDKEFA